MVRELKVYLRIRPSPCVKWQCHRCALEVNEVQGVGPSCLLHRGESKLRARGEAEHKAGKHTTSMSSMAEAQQLLGM